MLNVVSKKCLMISTGMVLLFSLTPSLGFSTAKCSESIKADILEQEQRKIIELEKKIEVDKIIEQACIERFNEMVIARKNVFDDFANSEKVREVLIQLDTQYAYNVQGLKSYTNKYWVFLEYSYQLDISEIPEYAKDILPLIRDVKKYSIEKLRPKLEDVRSRIILSRSSDFIKLLKLKYGESLNRENWNPSSFPEMRKSL